MTSERTGSLKQVAVLALVLAAALVIALQPRSVTTIDGDGVTRRSDCGIGYYLFGADQPVVTKACRDAFSGQAGTSLLLSLALLMVGGQATRLRREAKTDLMASDTPIGDEAPDENPVIPGEHPTVLAGLRAAARHPAFRGLTAAAVVLIGLLPFSLQPEQVITTDLEGATYKSDCGIGYQLFGAATGEVTSACRQAFAGRAVGAVLILAALGVVVGMLVWLVQYSRGVALGRVWGRAELWRPVVIRSCSVCAAMAILAFIASSAAGIRAATAAAPVTAADIATPTTSTTTMPEGAVVAPSEPFLPAAPQLDTSTSEQDGTEPRTSTTTTTQPVPLQIGDTAWYSAHPNPIEEATVPANALPVGSTAGSDDLHAFFRVRGTASTLVLGEATDAGTQRSPEVATIQLCPVTTSGWRAEAGGAFGEEPAYAKEDCTDLLRSADGTWKIDLSPFADRGGDRGFALVPSMEGATNYRVTLVGESEG